LPYLYVIKLSGESEPFSVKKVFESALRAGAKKQEALVIAEKVKMEAYPGIKTTEIFQKVSKLLKGQSKNAELRFNLKRSIKELGPTGFPFEKYICEILKSLDFEVKINQIIPGTCIGDYEIDFISEKNGLVYLGECKYRNIFNDKVDLKDSLANYARFSDIKDGNYFKTKNYSGKEIKTILVTNGKFTQKAIDYALCKGVELLGWRYPGERGLEYLVESKKLYPITILSSTRGYVKNILAENQIMLVKEILNLDSVKFSKITGMQEKDLLPLIKEAKLLMEN
jgi:hypothetical protein